MIRIGDPLPLCRLYKEMLSKDYFMTLLDLKEYIRAKEKLLDSYEGPNGVGKEDAGQHCQCRLFFFRPHHRSI